MRSVGECVLLGGVQSTVYSRAQRASIESGQRRERGSRKEGARQTAPLAEGGSPAQEPLTPSPRQASGSRAPCLTGKRGPPGSQSRRWPQPPAPAQAASLPAPQAGPSQPRSLAGPPTAPTIACLPPARRPLRLLMAPQTRSPMLLSRPLAPCWLCSGGGTQARNAAPRPCSEKASGPRGERRPPTPGEVLERAGGASAQLRAVACSPKKKETPPQGSAAPHAAPRTGKGQQGSGAGTAAVWVWREASARDAGAAHAQ